MNWTSAGVTPTRIRSYDSIQTFSEADMIYIQTFLCH